MSRTANKCWICGQQMRPRAAAMHKMKLHNGIQCMNCKQPIDPMAQFKHYLGQRTIEEINNSIRYFDTLDSRNFDDNQLKTEIKRVLMKQDEEKRGILLLPTYVSPYIKGSIFSRVRRLSDGELDRIRTEGIDEQRDCYEPPQDMIHAIGPGRLNRPGEQILYTANGRAGWATMACFEELCIEENEWFMIIEYEATEVFSAAMIGPKRFDSPENEHELSDEEREKSDLLLGFVRSKFQKHIALNNNHLYRVTRLIAREFSPGETRRPDIWQYPSVAREGGWNVAFHPNRRDKLRVRDVKIAKCLAYNSSLGARLIQIRYDTVYGSSGSDRRKLFAGSRPQAYFALTYANRVEKMLNDNVSFISRVDQAQNDRINNFTGRLVLFAEKNDDGGTYMAAREAV